MIKNKPNVIEYYINCIILPKCIVVTGLQEVSRINCFRSKVFLPSYPHPPSGKIWGQIFTAGGGVGFDVHCLHSEIVKVPFSSVHTIYDEQCISVNVF